MDWSIRFPHLGIYLEHVGKNFTVFGISIAYYGVIMTGKYEAADRKKDLMDEYLKWFCEENAVERNREDTEQRV